MRLPSQDPESCASTNSATRPGVAASSYRRAPTGPAACRTSELDQPRVRRREAARSEVELPEVVVEVDVEPLAPGLPCSVGRDRDQLLAHPSVTRGLRDHRVLDPGVDEPVPGNVDEAQQRLP